MNSDISISIRGHVLIKDAETGEILLDKDNAIHKENMSVAIARALAGQDSGKVYTMHFGTGGATVDALDAIVYATPNVSGAADLNTPVYSEVVDQDRGAPDGNQMSVRHVSGGLYSDIEIRCVLDKTEPSGQVTFDNVTTDLSGSFVFDEIGLKSDDGLLLTHITFNPIQKTSNRIFQIIYTLRIRLV